MIVADFRGKGKLFCQRFHHAPQLQEHAFAARFVGQENNAPVFFFCLANLGAERSDDAVLLPVGETLVQVVVVDGLHHMAELCNDFRMSYVLYRSFVPCSYHDKCSTMPYHALKQKVQRVENFLCMFRIENFIGEFCRSGLSGNMFPHVQVDAYHLLRYFRHILFEQPIDKPAHLVGVATCPDKKIFHDMFHTLFPAYCFPR